MLFYLYFFQRSQFNLSDVLSFSAKPSDLPLSNSYFLSYSHCLNSQLCLFAKLFLLFYLSAQLFYFSSYSFCFTSQVFHFLSCSFCFTYQLLYFPNYSFCFTQLLYFPSYSFCFTSQLLYFPSYSFCFTQLFLISQLNFLI